MNDETSASTKCGHRASQDSGVSSFNIASDWALQGAIFRQPRLYGRYWQRLEQDLIAIAASGEAEPGRASPYGQKYEVRGTLNGPAGKSARVLTVWIVGFGSDVPQFVTAFPGETA